MKWCSGRSGGRLVLDNFLNELNPCGFLGDLLFQMVCGSVSLANGDFGLAGFCQALFQGQSCHPLVYSSAAQGTLVAAAVFCPGMAAFSGRVCALVDKPLLVLLGVGGL